MPFDQILILIILFITILLFIFSRLRHDVVALLALSACVVTGIVNADEAFVGFSHPAVITVACVLVLSFSLQRTGAVDAFTGRLAPKANSPTLTIAALAGLAALLSAFMNNVGAMALLMPISIQLANRLKIAPGQVLMPVAFAAILGGMTTLIGTPPNLIVASFREQGVEHGFGMFDFTPVGLGVALCGVVFLALVGWRLVPARERADAASFDTGRYLTEVRIAVGGKAEGMTVWGLEKEIDNTEGQLLGMVRDGERVITPSWNKTLRAGDLLIIEAEPEKLSQLLTNFGLQLLENVKPQNKKGTLRLGEVTGFIPENTSDTNLEEPDKGALASWFDRRITVSSNRTLRGFQVGMRDASQIARSELMKPSDSREIVLVEMVVLPMARIIRQSAKELELRSRYNLNLLAISRQGKQRVQRLRETKISAGDVILMQGEPDRLANFAAQWGCVPLAERTIRVPSKRRAIMATLIMLLAVLGAGLGLMPAALSFGGGVVAVMALRLFPLRQIYESIDWSVVVLLAALIPVADALTQTGVADTIATSMLHYIPSEQGLIALAVILLVTMTLTDFMNNTATAAVMCPVALSAAQQLNLNSDTFLMAVAVGASCAFLTPIGHQNNTIILGPGGFRFGDYWKLGLPLELLVLVVALILLPLVWPLT